MMKKKIIFGVAVVLPLILSLVFLFSSRWGGHERAGSGRSPSLPRTKSGNTLSSVRKTALSAEFLEKLPEGLREYAGRDLTAALDYIEGLHGHEARQSALALFWASIADNPDFVAENLFKVKIPESDRIALMAEVVKRWQDLDAVLFWLDESPRGEHTGEMYGLLLTRVAKESPIEALNVLDGLQGNTRDIAARFFLAQWSSNDPMTTLENLSLLTREDEKLFAKNISTHMLCQNLSGDKLEDLLATWLNSSERAEDSPVGDVSVLVRSIVSDKIEKRNSEQVMAWISELPKDISDQAMAQFFGEFSVKDPLASIRAFESIERVKKLAVAPDLIESLFKADPKGAKDWLTSYEESAEKVEMTKSLIATWSTRDPISAYSWLGELPLGASRDAGIEQLIIRERASDPESAVLWAYEISDPELSRRHLDFLTRNFFDFEE